MHGNKSVSVFIRATIGGKQKYLVRKMFPGNSGRFEEISSGCFYLAWRENGKKKYQRVGTDPRQAVSARDLQESRLRGELPLAPQINPPSSCPMLLKAIDAFLGERKNYQVEDSIKAMARELADFEPVVHRKFLHEVVREDVTVKYLGWLREQGYSRRSQHNLMASVHKFLSNRGRRLLLKGDLPSYDEKVPDFYEPEQLSQFMAACNPEERVIFQFLAMTGLREGELVAADWSDIDFSRRVLTVGNKADFRTKTGRSRTIPMDAICLMR